MLFRSDVYTSLREEGDQRPPDLTRQAEPHVIGAMAVWKTVRTEVSWTTEVVPRFSRSASGWSSRFARERTIRFSAMPWCDWKWISRGALSSEVGSADTVNAVAPLA